MSKHSSAARTELAICQTLTEAAALDPLKSKHVMMLLDSFEHAGPNGTHVCLVFRPMGSTAASMPEHLPENEHVNRARGETCRYPVWMAKQILKHSLRGLAFLHENGIAHGDVQPGNLLFSACNLDLLEEKDLAPSQATRRLKRRDGKVDRWAPDHLILPGSLSKHADHGPEMCIKISDFGAGQYDIYPSFWPLFMSDRYLALWVTNPPKKTVTPVALRAPELIFGESPSSGGDIWSFWLPYL
jgi:non-specific serine/threonine protein kinase